MITHHLVVSPFVAVSGTLAAWSLSKIIADSKWKVMTWTVQTGVITRGYTFMPWVETSVVVMEIRNCKQV